MGSVTGRCHVPRNVSIQIVVSQYPTGGNGRAESIESAEMGRNCQRKLMDKLHGNGGVVSPTKEGRDKLS
ncbi:unnamed protein product [Prunus armeniaca]